MNKLIIVFILILVGLAIFLTLYATGVISFEEEKKETPIYTSSTSSPGTTIIPSNETPIEPEDDTITYSPEAARCSQYFGIDSTQVCKENKAAGVGWDWYTNIPSLDGTSFPGKVCEELVDHYLVDFKTSAFPNLTFRKKATSSDKSAGIKMFGEYAFKDRTVDFKVRPMDKEGRSLMNFPAEIEINTTSDCGSVSIVPDAGEDAYYKWNENNNVMNIKMDMDNTDPWEGWSKSVWINDNNKIDIIDQEAMGGYGSAWVQVPAGGGIRLDCKDNLSTKALITGAVATVALGPLGGLAGGATAVAAAIGYFENGDKATMIYDQIKEGCGTSDWKTHTPKLETTCKGGGRAKIKSFTCPSLLEENDE